MDLKIKRESDWIYFHLQTDEPITTERMKELQIQSGYAVMGYGFYAPMCEAHPDGTYITRWKCQASCE